MHTKKYEIFYFEKKWLDGVFVKAVPELTGTCRTSMTWVIGAPEFTIYECKEYSGLYLTVYIIK